MKKRYRRVYAKQYLTVIAAIVGVVLAGLISMLVMDRVTFDDHFVLPWAAGRAWLLQGTNPYSGTMVQEARSVLAGSSYQGNLPSATPFAEPLLSLFLYLPFSLLPYEIARVIWMIVLAVSVGLIGHFSLKFSGWETRWYEKVLAIVFVIGWFPGVRSILTGQLSPLVVMLLAAGFVSVFQEKDTTAGFLFALTFSSVTTSALILVFLLVWAIVRRRGAVLKAYFAGLAFLLIISLLLLPSWPLDWLRVLLENYQNLDWVHTPLMDLAGLLPGIQRYVSIALHVSLAIYFAVTWVRVLGSAEREFTWKVILLFLAAYLFHVQSSLYQLFLVMPALFYIFRYWSERWRGVGRVMAGSVIVLLGVGSWLLAPPGALFAGEVGLPLMTAGLPFVILILMTFTRWWALRVPKIPYEQTRKIS